MSSHSRGSFRVTLAILVVGIGALLLLGIVTGTMGSAGPHPAAPLSHPTPSARSLMSASFSFSPNPVSAGTQLQGMVTLSGGTSPFQLWFNNTAPGCGPQSNPVMSSSSSVQFNCTPSSPGTFNVHLDALDNAVPPNKASQSVTLTVNSNNNGGGGNGSGGKNGNGNNGSGSNTPFQLPSALLTMLMIFGIVFLGAIVALAVGTIATAVLVSKRLRQLTETMAKTNNGSSPEKPSK